MVEFEKILGESGSVDNIDEETWRLEVMGLLSNISKMLAKELQQELKIRWDKGSYLQELDQAPPTRILSLALFLSA